MILILLIWCYLGITFFNVGFAFNKLLRIKELDAALTLVFGMFCITLFASFWAIFGRINYEFQVALILFQLLVVVKYKIELSASYYHIFQRIREINSFLKIYFLVTSIVILFQSAGNSFFVDNETYYIQTIKWLNEYGLVPGLANLHIFFGQTSGWHILQSVFSFSYLANYNNDLNGFLLLFVVGFSISKLDSYFKTSNFQLLWIGLLPMMLVLLIPFSGAPSPDLAVILISILLFYYFLKRNENPSTDALTILSLLAFFVVYIKVAALPILSLPLIYYISHFHEKQTETIPTRIIGVAVLTAFIIKNTLLTGYPLYPSSLFVDYFNSDKTIPKTLYEFWWNGAKNYDFVVSQSEYFKLSCFEILSKWATSSWFTIVLTITISLLILLFPFTIRKFKNKNSFWIIYLTMITQIVFLVATTPQHRFVLPFLLFFGLLLFSLLLAKKTPIYVTLYTVLALASIFVLFPTAIGKNHSQIDFYPAKFSLSQLVLPQQNSNLRAAFSTKSKSNLKYNSPDEHSYIWVTGDGKLPCVNTRQIEYFEKNLGYIPQLRGATLANGFYSKKVDKP